MVAEVDICNRALLANGADRILAFDTATDGDGVSSKEQILCNEFYPALRDEEMSKHLWNFAMQRAILTPDVAVPLYGYDTAFQMPNDLLVLAEVEGDQQPPVEVASTDDDVPWRVEGKKIFSNEDSQLNIRYVKRVTDPNLFSQYFINLLKARLAYEFAIPLENDQVLYDRLKNEYLDLAAGARFSDATEDPTNRFQADTWLIARENW